MALPRPIFPPQTDALSPIDDNLMDSIREDLDYLDGLLGGANASGIEWVINGDLDNAYFFSKPIDGLLQTKEFTPNKIAVTMKKGGTAGSVTVDVRKVESVNNPIVSVLSSYKSNTQSITRKGGAFTPSSIQRSTPAINTLQINLFESAYAVDSIVRGVGPSSWRINLATPIDTTYVAVGDSIEIASSTNPANDGIFQITEIDQDNYKSIVIFNDAGVQELSSPATAQTLVFEYVFTNPVDTFGYVVGESVALAGHTDPLNNGSFEIFGVNDSGNNLIIKNPAGDTQGGAAGTASSNRWALASGSSVSTNFVVGENTTAASFGNAGNNGVFEVVGVNSPNTNTLYVYNESAVADVSPAGTASPNRFEYNMGATIAGGVTVGQLVRAEAHTSSANDGDFEVVEVGASSVVVANDDGALQAGVAGTITCERKIIAFESDPTATSADLAIGSLMEFDNTNNPDFDQNDLLEPWEVIDINVSAGFNVVIDAVGLEELNAPRGAWISLQNSILNNPVVLNSQVAGNRPYEYIATDSTDFISGDIPEGTKLGLFLKMEMEGSPQDLTVTIY